MACDLHFDAVHRRRAFANVSLILYRAFCRALQLILLSYRNDPTSQDLVATHWTYPHSRPGRPAIPKGTSALILHLASESPE